MLSNPAVRTCAPDLRQSRPPAALHASRWKAASLLRSLVAKKMRNDSECSRHRMTLCRVGLTPYVRGDGDRMLRDERSLDMSEIDTMLIRRVLPSQPGVHNIKILETNTVNVNAIHFPPALPHDALPVRSSCDLDRQDAWQLARYALIYAGPPKNCISVDETTHAHGDVFQTSGWQKIPTATRPASFWLSGPQTQPLHDHMHADASEKARGRGQGSAVWEQREGHIKQRQGKRCT